MYIVIGGAGLTGERIASALAHRHDVVAIDADQRRCDQLYAELGILAINGSATDIRVLEEAGIQRADVALGLMRTDADNLTFTLLCQHFGVHTRVVRMGDPRYREAYKLAGATDILNSAEMFMREIVFSIERPQARRITEIGGGAAEILSIHIPEHAAIAGMTVQQLTQMPSFPETCVIAGIFDADQRLTIPRGSAAIVPHGEVMVVARAEDVAAIVEYLTRKK